METNTQKLSIQELTALVFELQSKITALEAKITPTKTDSVEMTDDHARRILNGDLRTKTHKECAAALGLTYGQVYSCRGKYTFKAIHKEVEATEGYTNIWAK